MTMTGIEGKSHRFALMDLQASLPNCDNLRLARMRNQMHFRARRFHQRHGATQPGFGVEPEVFGPNAENDPAFGRALRRWSD